MPNYIARHFERDDGTETWVYWNAKFGAAKNVISTVLECLADHDHHEWRIMPNASESTKKGLEFDGKAIDF